MSLVFSYIPRKHKDSSDFMIFSWGTERDQWYAIFTESRYLQDYKTGKIWEPNITSQIAAMR